MDFSKVLDVMDWAGQNLLPHFGEAPCKHYKSSLESDAVTELDEQTEKFLKKELEKIDSSIGFKGEEFGIETKCDRFWLADPIDGTAYFIRGLPQCTSMLALIEDGEITFSVINDFVNKNLYWAQKGKGAFLNKKPIKVSNRALNKALIHVEMNLNHKENLPKYLELYKTSLVLGEYPSGIHFALTASGAVEGKVCMDPFGKDYDFAPGQLLVKEAGGMVANIGRNNFDYKNLNFLAVNKQVYSDLTTGRNPIFPTFD